MAPWSLALSCSTELLCCCKSLLLSRWKSFELSYIHNARYYKVVGLSLDSVLLDPGKKRGGFLTVAFVSAVQVCGLYPVMGARLRGCPALLYTLGILYVWICLRLNHGKLCRQSGCCDEQLGAPVLVKPGGFAGLASHVPLPAAPSPGSCAVPGPVVGSSASSSLPASLAPPLFISLRCTKAHRTSVSSQNKCPSGLI